MTWSDVMLLVFVVVVVGLTVLYLRALRRGESFWRSTGAWLKQIIDALFGVG